jgi:hypothetical protein
MRFNYYHNEKLDIGMAIGINYNAISYAPGNKLKKADTYFVNTFSLELDYLLPASFRISSDLNYMENTGLAAGFNSRVALWNMALSKTVLKSGELRLSVNDLLNQNTGVTRNAVPGYIEDMRSLVLKRYFLATFTWKASRMGGKSMSRKK